MLLNLNTTVLQFRMQVAFLLFKGMQLSNAESHICKCVRKKNATTFSAAKPLCFSHPTTFHFRNNYLSILTQLILKRDLTFRIDVFKARAKLRNSTLQLFETYTTFYICKKFKLIIYVLNLLDDKKWLIKCELIQIFLAFD